MFDLVLDDVQGAKRLPAKQLQRVSIHGSAQSPISAMVVKSPGDQHSEKLSQLRLLTDVLDFF
ncbi:hypothetical protein EYF80_031001 [Liparis tanakae]|uniref:Uncharacterized protein n=1 Tax=Liparis tanakae TaxID=230148 RepID=A0A4Z2GZ02_9TELE|nr:hypothetical protein EYF80_031001 [Liparis tanakae]